MYPRECFVFDKFERIFFLKPVFPYTNEVNLLENQRSVGPPIVQANTFFVFMNMV
jgi:hypothetical protein